MVNIEDPSFNADSDDAKMFVVMMKDFNGYKNKQTIELPLHIAREYIENEIAYISSITPIDQQDSKKEIEEQIIHIKNIHGIDVNRLEFEDSEGNILRGKYLILEDNTALQIDEDGYTYNFITTDELQLFVLSQLSQISQHSLIFKVPFERKIFFNLDITIEKNLTILTYVTNVLQKKKGKIHLCRVATVYFNDVKEHINKKTGQLIVKITPSVAKFVDFILANFNIITFSDNNEMFYYNGGIYVRGVEALIREMCFLVYHHECQGRFVEEAIKRISYATYRDRKSIDANFKLTFENGVYDFDTFTFSDYDPKQISFNKLSVTYDPTATCKEIDLFLEQILVLKDQRNNMDTLQENQKLVDLVYEVIGYCLYKDHNIQKAFMMYGGGANGKSTLINLIKHFLGGENIASISLQQLSEDKFAIAGLYNKLANLYADLSSEALTSTGVFKQITGGDPLTAELKFKSPFNFVNFSKQIFSANQIPVAHDESDAFFRRWIIISFPNSFIENADKNIMKKLTTKEELSGLLNMAILGLKRLKNTGSFTYTKSNDEIKKIYTQLSNSVTAFADQKLDIGDPDDFITKENMYGVYCKYCYEIKTPPVSLIMFSKRITQSAHYIRSGRPSEDKKQVHAWMGVKFIDSRDYDKKKNESDESRNSKIEEFDA